MTEDAGRAADVDRMQDTLLRFVREFGLLQPEQTPCGQPMPVSEAHAMTELAGVSEMRQAELCRRLRLQKSTVSRLVGQLVADGRVERSSASDDGRGVVLRLTPAGVRAANALGDARRAKFDALMDRIPAAERDDIVRSLARLTEALVDERP